ncbi:DMT family transporter [uncultured Agrobacterium sp.]|uniref:DMT family transporter n=1 Tax=uncultured Agrobacterium sp. TaxID=157277 RepID=UPI0025EA7769|nr:DMT family transporter [uncultured Agrobacterium sp.]
MITTHEKRALGIVLVCGCYMMYSLHYATMKWMGNLFGVWQLLFIRSIVMVFATIMMKPSVCREVIRSPYKGATAVRALFQIACTFCFFVAAKLMPLGQVTTLYAAAPVIIVLLAIPILGEKVGRASWAAVVLGMIGTVIAANPTGSLNPVPTLLAFASGIFWALAVIYTRKAATRESTQAQLLTTGCVFCLVSGLLMDWTTPANWFEIGMCAILGIEILLAQMLFFEGYRFAPASVLAPLEYQSLIWVSILGFVMFGDVPTIHTVVGATLIVTAGILLTLYGNTRKPVMR